jgi:ABC-type Zn uptake system ZnuABC Zn-binding protein ZnuA
LRAHALVATLLLTLAAGALHGAPLRVTASFPIPADWVREIGGGRVVVETAAPAGADPHSWQPGVRDVRRLRDSALLVAVSPVMEDWFAQMVAANDLRARVVWLGESLESAPQAAGSSRDPHLWLDPALAEKMCERLARALAGADPAGASAYNASFQRYAQRLRHLDAEARAVFDAVPAARRLLPAAHDNLSRIAARYGLRTIALNGAVTSEAPAPSARRLAAFIRAARQAGVPIFHDAPEPTPLVLSVTRDAGLPAPVRLYTDTLPAAPHPASTYVGMFRENLRRFAAALIPAGQPAAGSSAGIPTAATPETPGVQAREASPSATTPACP